MEILSALSRWIHVLAGIVWIGMLYFFNFVNGPFQGTQDGETKKKVIPELLPRALYWFRWGAAWTWVTGVLLLLLVFYHGEHHVRRRTAPGRRSRPRADRGHLPGAVRLRRAAQEPAREGSEDRSAASRSCWSPWSRS